MEEVRKEVRREGGGLRRLGEKEEGSHGEDIQGGDASMSHEWDS